MGRIQPLGDFTKFVYKLYVFRKIGIIFVSAYGAKTYIMKKSTLKSIKGLSVATLVVGGLALVIICWEMIAIIVGKAYTPVVWNPDIKGWQIFILLSRIVFSMVLFILCCIFLFRTNRGLADGEIFPKSNISLIRWTALVAALLCFANSNYSAALKGVSELTLDTSTLLAPLVILLFAGLYKVAYLAAEDSKLAI